MKKLVCISIAASFLSFPVHASNGHNGIRFDMSQNQIEEMGFVCNPPEKKKPSVVAECHHMDMSGVLFGYPTQDYVVKIGPAKKVDDISATLIGAKDLADILALHQKIKKFFPKVDEEGTHSAPKYYRRDSWRAKNNSGISLFLMKGMPPVTKTELTISFYSPRSMDAVDKLRSERAASKE